jgi:3-deoxy-D-manno-octulosonic acid kinase
MRHHNPLPQGRERTLYDPALLPDPGEWLFDPAELERRGLLRQRTSGRRSAFVFEVAGQGLVLRHFWRGGMIGRWLADRYFWTGYERSRPVREWRLLQTLSGEGLPVPRPAALRLQRSGLLYRADLITVLLPQTRTLAERLEKAPLPAAAWQRVGAAIGALHRRGACHADLNARNILIGEGGAVYVIDWDRGRIRRPHGGWQRRNLDRLFRSLNKISATEGRLHYEEDQARGELWAGYGGA